MVTESLPKVNLQSLLRLNGLPHGAALNASSGALGRGAASARELSEKKDRKAMARLMASFLARASRGIIRPWADSVKPLPRLLAVLQGRLRRAGSRQRPEGAHGDSLRPLTRH